MKFLICLIFISQYLAVPLVNANTIDHIKEHHHAHSAGEHHDHSHTSHEEHNDHDHQLIEQDKVVAVFSSEVEHSEHSSFAGVKEDIKLVSDLKFIYVNSLDNYTKYYSPPDPNRVLPLLI
ncbi:MAG: hypothetical protein CME62_12255 [Halobacteriovoraceae bacterium]|nr:hypothetical protein [Halobacteriovoraceae bacterium]|tara:strand:+ start:554 stop:916 length:363 start_codon:yes stop_codon:yes gene_type:complete